VPNDNSDTATSAIFILLFYTDLFALILKKVNLKVVYIKKKLYLCSRK